MATVTSLTAEAITDALAAKADLTDGILPDAQAPSISVKKDTWVVDLSDHGGVNDGVTSNDAAFVSALAAINPTFGGKIVLRAGSYLINGTTAITLATVGTIIEGAGNEATRIIIGSGFTDTAAIKITQNDCRVQNLSIAGASSTTTTNPYVDAIYIGSVQRSKVLQVSFWHINAWAVHIVAGSTSGTNPNGTILEDLIIRSCAAGVSILGNAGSGSCSILMNNLQIVSAGVATGTNANLDGIHIEDASDIEASSLISWMGAGTGAALHVKGACIHDTFEGVNLQGCATGPAVLIEDGPNGSPYSTRIAHGVVQLGTVGIRVTGAAIVTSLHDLSAVSNKTHGISIEGTGNPVLISDPYFAGNGSGASGNNYDINWSGSSIGSVVNPRFESAVTASGTAGVQKSVNVALNQNVRCWNTMFAGVGQNSANWFSNIPNAVVDTTTGMFNFLTKANFAVGITTQGNLSSQPASSTAVVLSSNILGTASFDSFRITADGAINIGVGAGTAARDTTWGRQSAAGIGTPDSDIIIALAGKGLKIKEGSNARMGTVTLSSAGIATVSNTSVTANTRIFVGFKSAGSGTVGAPFVHDVTVGTGFTIHSTSGTDNSIVSWILVEAA